MGGLFRRFKIAFYGIGVVGVVKKVVRVGREKRVFVRPLALKKKLKSLTLLSTAPRKHD